MASTQASIAVSADGENWLLVNASPDILKQIAATPQLHPRGDSLRNSPIAGVVLTNGEVDAVAGLLSLREGQPFSIYAHQRVLDILEDNSIFAVLKPGVVARHAIALDSTVDVARPDGESIGLTVEAFAVPGKPALYNEGDDPNADRPGDTIGLRISASDGSAHMYVLTACAQVTDGLAERLRDAPLVFFDGTVWLDDEMIRQGLSQKTGSRMGHIAMTDAIAALEGLGIGQKIFLHINNSNPALHPGSEERQQAERAGWQVAADGMEIRL